MRLAFLFRPITLLVALGFAAVLPARGADAVDPFADIPNVEFVYYDVGGNSAEAIRRAINAQRLVDPNDHKPVDALTRWSFKWRWPRTADGCDLAAAEVTFSAVVTLPRLVGEERLGARLRTRWQRYAAGLRVHEAGHASYAYALRDDVLAAIKGSDCANATQAARAVLARISAHDVSYDAATRHGATQGSSFP